MRVAEAVERDSEPEPAAVARLAELLRTARRPVFVAGLEARPADARDALTTLATLSGALLATSTAARGLFAGNPWSIDLPEGFSPPFASELMRDADLVVAWGSTGDAAPLHDGGLIAPETKVVRVDASADASNVHTHADLGLAGDVRATAQAAVDALRTCPRTLLTWRTPQLRRRIARHSQ
ncbi:hypothetical protein [Phytoactinopolyspora mesophila]|uniref:Thiamine pyrophosphate enzyme central domain-containing protein n=1 Tax=Phytoactinopolyspora mesophila TaxID=2650750 RepID=A0A7K3LZL7_9ACTN|nr:hypothetical protein [Phytoactinopolyspora mesophila]NDL56439.1 hypothetical protein [Phytoactinopolyspora mesophila]